MTTRPTFPVAAHSYFGALNKSLARKQFLESASEQPVFRYPKQFSETTVAHRLAQVTPDSVEARMLSFVHIAAQLQHDNTSLAAFRKANTDLFGPLHRHYAQAILYRASKQVTPTTKLLWQEIIERIGKVEIAPLQMGPSEEVFQTYKQYIRRYIQPIKSKGRSVSELMQLQLEALGLDKIGWKVDVTDTAHHAVTTHHTKSVSVGEFYEPRTVRAKKRIVVHEIYGHALRGQQATQSEAEGFAILIEQLMSSTFKYRRSYRYLAVALGWGVCGQPMNFREVFEILWRIMVIGSKYSHSVAKRHAFDECYRAFRGGRSDIAGAVFLKDAQYFDANIRMWEVLAKQELSYNEFVDIIEGRRTLLS